MCKQGTFFGCTQQRGIQQNLVATDVFINNYCDFLESFFWVLIIVSPLSSVLVAVVVGSEVQLQFRPNSVQDSVQSSVQGSVQMFPTIFAKCPRKLLPSRPPNLGLLPSCPGTCVLPGPLEKPLPSPLENLCQILPKTSKKPPQLRPSCSGTIVGCG